jgi:hypothetical protein
MRRAGFFATLAAGFSLVAAALHGMAGVDRTLTAAAAQPTVQPELVREFRPRHSCDGDGDGDGRGHGQPPGV